MITFSRLAAPRFVMVLDPDLVHQIFHAPPDRLRTGELNASLLPMLGQHSLLLNDGPEHTRWRNLLLPCFHGERMRAHESAIREATDRAIDSWPVGEPFPLVPSLNSLILEIITRIVVGPDGAEQGLALRRAAGDLLDPPAPRLGILSSVLARIGVGVRERARRFERSRARIDALIDEAIARRRAAPDLAERTDVLSSLLLARDEDGEAVTDAELRDCVVTLLFTGYKSTQTALAWAFAHVLDHPEVLERLRRDLASGDERYLDAVVSETLRVIPVAAGTGRVVGESPYDLDGHRLPPGTELNIPVGQLHRQADRFPDPLAFRPERFLDPDADTRTWVPFSHGSRRCVGASFAPFEFAIVISRVLERARLVPAGRRRERATRMELTVRNGISFLPRLGVRVVLTTAPQP